MGANEGSAIIRSINNQHPSLVRFVNTTRFEVEILWINYEGQAVSYAKLEPGKHLDMRTFATHPWIFLESQTMERFLVEGNDVFYPKPWFPEPGDRARRQTTPFIAPITIPMYDLREIAMKTIKVLLLDDEDAYLLEIPKNLQRELANMNPRKNRS